MNHLAVALRLLAAVLKETAALMGSDIRLLNIPLSQLSVDARREVSVGPRLIYGEYSALV